jgi:transcriptional regulator with XRE-family HTH domain
MLCYAVRTKSGYCRRIAKHECRPAEPDGNSDSLTRFGERLRNDRQTAGLSLASLAAGLGVTKGYLSRLERGRTTPSEVMITRLAKALGTDPTTLSVLAGRIPTDVQHILSDHPVEAPALLRETFAPYEATETVEIAHPESASRPPDTGTHHHLRPAIRAPSFETVLGDCIYWLEERSEKSLHAVVTDPPYGLKEYTEEEKGKLRAGRGGVWRIPPSFDGWTRAPLPRFTVLTDEDQTALRDFFARWAGLIFKVLVPGGHVFVATNPLVSHLVYGPMIEAGFEKRGEIIRLVQTLRGGDRPKNAHREFSDVTVMPRSAWEPWGLFRKPCEGRVQSNLRKWGTGGLRRLSPEQPFTDVIRSSPTRNGERAIAPH